jgi:p-cumate 2,3-dioxygenase alpha subunit
MAREPHGDDEAQMRVFWRHWARQMGSAGYLEVGR